MDSSISAADTTTLQAVDFPGADTYRFRRAESGRAQTNHLSFFRVHVEFNALIDI